MPYSVQKVKKGKGVTIEVAGLNSVGRSHEVLRMRYLPSKKGNSDLDIGPSVVLTTNEDDTMVFWGKAGGAVVERQVIWGAGSSQLLEQGIDWVDAGIGVGNFTFPKNSTVPPQHVFLAAADADGASPGMKNVKCRLTARPIFNVSLDQGNVTTNSISLRIGLGLCRDQEDEQLLLQRTTLTWCNSKDNCANSSNHHSTSSESKGASLTLTNLPNSTCICIISLEVETVLGSATTNFSSSCSFCTVPVNAPSILAAALIEGPKDSNTSLLFINLEKSTFPTGASSACHIRVTSMASVTIQMPCEEFMLTPLTSLPSHPLNVTVASVLGNSIGPKRESHITRTPPPPTRVSARIQNDTVEVTFNEGSAFSPLSSCQVKISWDSESKWHALPSVTPHCKADECSVVSPFKFFPCSTYQYSIRCDVSVDLDPTAIQSIRSLLNPVHFFATNHVKENSLKFTSDWSLIKTRSLPCITTGTSPFYIILVVVLVLIFVAAVLIYLWRFSERVQRLIKRFNFKLPHYVPPHEVPQEREGEPFIEETPVMSCTAPHLTRTPTLPQSSPSQLIATSPTFRGPSAVDRPTRPSYSPTKPNDSHSDGPTISNNGYQPHPPPYVQSQSIRSRTTTTTSLASSEYVPLPDVLTGQELEE